MQGVSQGSGARQVHQLKADTRADCWPSARCRPACPWGPRCRSCLSLHSNGLGAECPGHAGQRVATVLRAHASTRLGVQVLTTGSWPTHPALMCSLPREVEACCSDFKAFYLRSHSGRKLQWQTNMGNAGASSDRLPGSLGSRQLQRLQAHQSTSARSVQKPSYRSMAAVCWQAVCLRSDCRCCRADLRADFDGRKHELNVSTYQMAILMLFNSADSLSYTEIQAATSIPPPDLKRSLQSLACAKVTLRLLSKAHAWS